MAMIRPEAIGMNVRKLIGRIPERLIIGVLGLAGAIAMAYGPKLLAWFLRLFL